MSTTTLSPTLRAALAARLQAIHDADGITPSSEAKEKLLELASAVVKPYLLEPFAEMRQSEVDWIDRAIDVASRAASEAAGQAMVDRLAEALADPPPTLIAHAKSEQLRADLGGGTR